jgi:hypothetical protein
MSDGLRNPTAGPDSMYSEQLPPSRGQYETIAVLALDLLGVPKPQTRLDATVALTRLQLAQRSDQAPPPPLPKVEAF